MRIQELRLIRYGKFTARTVVLPAGERDIHLVVGPNEAGKSTFRTAIGDWLFGIPARTPLAFLHPMPELRVGGVLERVATGGGAAQRLDFERTKGNKNTLRTPADAVLPDSNLQPWLGGLQALDFNRMHALDHTTLVEGGAGILAASDDIGRLLFQSAAGIEHLGDALQKLQAEADALWAPRRSGSRSYYQAVDAYEAAQAAFKQSTLRTRDWVTQHETLVATESALALARAREVDINRQLNRLERIRRVRPMLLALESAQSRLQALLSAGEPPLLPENAAQVLVEAGQSMALAQADLDRLEHSIAKAQNELQATPVDRNLLSLAGDITELNERRLQFRAHRTDMVKRAEDIRRAWTAVQECAASLGWAAETEDAVRQRLPPAPVRSRLVRLLKDRGALDQALRTAQATLAERQQQVLQAGQALQELAAVAVHPGLVATVESALKLGDPAAATDALQQQLEVLRLRIESGLAALGAWRCEPAALKAMLAPELPLLQGLIDLHRSDAAAALLQQDALDAKAHDIQRLELELLQLVRDFQPVSSDQVHAARRLRDAAWQQIKAAPTELAAQAAAFERQVAQADSLADGRLDRAQHEAARQAKAERLEQQRLALRQAELLREVVRERTLARQAHWHALARNAGLPGLPLELAPAWLHQRQQVLTMWGQQAELAGQQAALREAADHLRHTLWSMLKAESADASTQPLGLTECVRQARACISLSEQAHGQRRALEQQAREGQGGMEALQAQVVAAQDAWDGWCRSWQAATQAAGYDAAAPADQVEAEIGVMQDIDPLLAQMRSIRSERIETMQADLDGLEVTARQLAARVAPDLTGLASADTALELAERLDRARQAASATAALQMALEQAQAEQSGARQRQVAVQASLAPLLTAAGEADLRALAGAIERSDERRAIERAIGAAQADLAQAADGLTSDALRAELAATGPDESLAEYQRFTQSRADAVDEISTLSNRYGTQKSAFDAFDGQGLAAQAESRRQEAMATMADAAEGYLRLHTAVRVLKWSMEKFRQTRQGPMLARASAHFQGLTLGSFSRLLVDAEGAAPRLFGIRAGGEQVEVAGMSEGTRDQLYLALRLAALELHIDQGLNMPLIADDLFINFDDQRTKAGLQVLGALSHKMQIVFLTHHEHLVPLAQQVLGEGLNVVRL
jgi:uncharacterized protein YhaN